MIAVGVSAKVREALHKADRAAGMIRVAAEAPPFPPKGQEGSQPKRKITSDFDFNPKALKPMARMLWAMSVSLGHALAAYRQFTKLKSATISPDGMLGGRGYVMTVKDVRKSLYDACEALSAISDTIHDELNAPHWKPKLADLGANDAEDIKKLISDATENLDNPEGEAEESLDEIESGNDGRGGTPNDVRWSEYTEESEEQDASRLPDGGDASAQAHNDPLKKSPGRDKQASYSYLRANSSLPVNTLPGPRVDHLDRGEAQGPYGSYNEDEPTHEPEWTSTHREYDYPSEWDNEALDKAASTCLSLRELVQKRAGSAMPSDATPTDGDDFGLGFGAHGKGLEKGLANPDTGDHGVFGPSSGLPSNPGGATRDYQHSDTTPRIDMEHAGVWASTLPNDNQPPVARSDYFQGPKGNIVSESQMPGDESVSYSYDRDTPNVGQGFENTDNPYMKWDYTTHDTRPDPTFGIEGSAKSR